MTSIQNESGPTVILLHGYGADGGDLVPLWRAVPQPERFNWIFPEAPWDVLIAPGFYGKAWFPIDVAAFQNAVITDQTSALMEVVPPGLQDAGERIVRLLSEYGLNSENSYLGGFSQGSMAALQASLLLETSCRGLILFSCNLVARKEWEIGMARHEGTRFFQSHGKMDPVLPYSSAVELEKLLLKNKWKGQLRPFQGGHEIPVPVLNGFSQFISSGV